MKPPATVALHVPYADNERQFLLQAVVIAVQAFRRLRGNPDNKLGEVSSRSIDHDIAVSPLFLGSPAPPSHRLDS